MGIDGRPELNTAPEEALHCARHPTVETYLRCGSCGTPICPRCLIQTPVGARCPTCANVSRLPTFDVKPAFFARGLAGALVAGAVVGAVWGYISQSGGGFGGFFILFIGIGIGWAISESIAAATNHKRGLGLQICAIAGVLLCFLVHNLVGYSNLLPVRDFLIPGRSVVHDTDVWSFIATGVAAFFAASRLSAGR